MKKSILLLFSFVLLSCTTSKEVVYYQDIDSREFASIESINTHPKIQINDILKARLSS